MRDNTIRCDKCNVKQEKKDWGFTLHQGRWLDLCIQHLAEFHDIADYHDENKVIAIDKWLGGK